MTRSLSRMILGMAVITATGVAVTALAPTPAAAAPYDGKTVIREGHVDVFYTHLEAGQPVVAFKDDTVWPESAVLRDPDDVVIHVRPSVDARLANAFIADGLPGFTEVGQTVYVLPQTNQLGRVFAGFGYDIPEAATTTVITYTLLEVDGPGNFATWQAGDDGAVPFFNSAVPGSSFTSQANHEHLAWGFTELGEYRITIGVSVQLPGGGAPLVAEPATYTFWVGEELPSDPEPELLPTSVALTATPTSVQFARTTTLRATVQPRGGTTAAPLGVGGVVEFYLGDTKVGETAPHRVTGQANLTVTPPALGEHRYHARYVPPATHAVSVSSEVTVSVVPAATQTYVATDLADAAAGQPVTIGVQVNPSWVAGQVTVRSGDLVVAQGEVSGGRFRTAVDDLPVGDHQLRAFFTSAVPEAGNSETLPTILAPVSIHEGAPRGSWTRTVVDREHVDAFSVTYGDGALRMGTRIDFQVDSKTPLPKYGYHTERIDPATTVFHVPDLEPELMFGLFPGPGGRQQVPDDPNFAFLGAPGDVYWAGPHIQDETPFLFAGFEAESIPNGVFADNRIDIHLVDVEAPDGGRFEAYYPYSGGVWRMLSSTDPAHSSTPFNTGGHDHFTWAFTKLGTYVLHVKATATLLDGTPVESQVVEYTWVIGDLTDAPVVTVEAETGTGTTQLTATVEPAADGYVEFRDSEGSLLGFSAVTDGTAQLAASLAAGSHTIVAEFVPAALDRDAPATSEPVTVQVDPTGPPLSQTIVVTLDESQGALVVSVHPNDRDVALAGRLAASGDRWEADGVLRPVTVVDTRSGSPGWAVSGQVGEFSGASGTFSGSYLGWSPRVLSQSSGQEVSAGSPVVPGFPSGDGLSPGAPLASSPAGHSLGTSVLDADLRLEVPTSTPVGEYQAVLTLTAI